MKKTWYQLPEEDCERLNSTEMRAVRWSLAAENSVSYAQRDLEKRLECIPEGKRRWRLMLGQLRALCNDLIGTIPVKQCKTIRNVMNDMELRMVPKGTKHDTRVVLDAKDLGYLVTLAKKEMCTSCILTDDECRRCELYKILEIAVPLDDYGDGTICPYNMLNWINE